MLYKIHFLPKKGQRFFNYALIANNSFNICHLWADILDFDFKVNV